MDSFRQIDTGCNSTIVICINARILEANIAQLRIRHFAVNFNRSVCTAASLLGLAVLKAQIVKTVFRDFDFIVELLSHSFIGLVCSCVNEFHIRATRGYRHIRNIRSTNGAVTFGPIVFALNSKIVSGILIYGAKGFQVRFIRNVFNRINGIDSIQV